MLIWLTILALLWMSVYSIQPFTTNALADQKLTLSSLKQFCTFFDRAIHALNITLRKSKSENNCTLSIHKVVNHLNSQDEWPITMVDAAGKCPSDLSHSSQMWLGSYNECMSIEQTPGQSPFNGLYCLSYVMGNASDFDPYIPRIYPNIWSYGVCVPDKCDSNDVKNLTNAVLKTLWPKSALESYVVCQSRELPWTAAAICILCICLIFLLLMVVGTTYDIQVYQPFYNQSSKSFFRSVKVSVSMEDEEETKPLLFTQKPMGGSVVDKNPPLMPNSLARFFLCFSLNMNIIKILRLPEKEETLGCIHGVKVLSMLWLILGHSYLYSLNTFSNSKAFVQITKYGFFQIILNSHIAVDSFFLISGTLVSYLSLKRARLNEGYVNWKVFYFHRFWRLTPTYMMILALYVIWLPYVASGPLWPQNGVDGKNCINYWWTNLLYINNFINNTCMQWSWYLANDMQFHLLSPLILLPLMKFEYVGLALIVLFLFGTSLATGLISKINKFEPGILTANLNTSFVLHNKAYYEMYVRPYCRIGPYIVGLLLGYILYKYENRPLLKRKSVRLMLWLFSLLINIAVVFGLFSVINDSDMDNFSLYAFYNSTYHTAWAFSVAWIIFSCTKVDGGLVQHLLTWKVWQPLANLNYCVYLIHPIVLIILYQSKQNLDVFTHFVVIYYFLGTVVLSYGAAFILSAMFEFPLKSLEKVVLGKDEWRG